MPRLIAFVSVFVFYLCTICLVAVVVVCMLLATLICSALVFAKFELLAAHCSLDCLSAMFFIYLFVVGCCMFDVLLLCIFICCCCIFWFVVVFWFILVYFLFVVFLVFVVLIYFYLLLLLLSACFKCKCRPFTYCFCDVSFRSSFFSFRTYKYWDCSYASTHSTQNTKLSRQPKLSGNRTADEYQRWRTKDLTVVANAQQKKKCR